MDIVKNTYKNYKNTDNTIITEDKTGDNDFFTDIFDNNFEIENDELEDYLLKPAVSLKTDPLQWWKVNILFLIFLIKFLCLLIYIIYYRRMKLPTHNFPSWQKIIYQYLVNKL